MPAPSYFGYVSNPADNADSGAVTSIAVTPPASMEAGDLVYMLASVRESRTLSILIDGSQAWDATANRANAAVSTRGFWCVFNGTWTADPSVQQSGAAERMGVTMLVFRPSGPGGTWVIDVAASDSTFAAPSSPFDVTIPGITTTVDNAVVLGGWISVDDNTWALQTGGWLNPGGVTQIRNSGGSQFSISQGYLVKAVAGATGNVTNRQVANGGDVGHIRILAFHEVVPAIIAPDDIAQGQDLEASGLTQNHVIPPADLEHAEELEASGLTQNHVLAPEDLEEAQVLGASQVVLEVPKVLIGGVQHSILDDGTVRIEDQAGARSTASFSIRDLLGVYRFKRGQRVEIRHEGQRRFGGFIDSSNERRLGGGPGLRHDIQCVDNHYKSDKRLIILETYENAAVEDIVADLVEKYLEEEGVMLADALIDAGPVIGEVRFSYVRVSDALEELAGLAGYWWRIDQNDVLRFRARGTEAAPWTLTGADCKAGTVRASSRNAMYRNKQYLRGLTDVTDPQVETRKEDGVTRAFTMSYPLAKVPSLKVNTVAVDPSDVGIKGVDAEGTKRYYWSKGDPVIAQDPGETLLTDTDELETTYQGEYDLVVVSQDPAAIAERQAVEGGGTGIVESVIEDSSLPSRVAGLEKAAALLATYAAEARTLEFVTRRQGLAPGQVLTVDLPEHGFDGAELLVETVSSERKRQDAGFVYEHRVTAIAGPAIGGWPRFFQRLYRTPSFVDRLSVGSGSISILPFEFEETTGWTEEFDAQVYACPLPAPDLYPSPTLYPC